MLKLSHLHLRTRRRGRDYERIAEEAMQIARAAARRVLGVDEDELGFIVRAREGSLVRWVTVGGTGNALETLLLQDPRADHREDLLGVREKGRLLAGTVCDRLIDLAPASESVESSRITTPHVTRLIRIATELAAGVTTTEEARDARYRVFKSAAAELPPDLSDRIEKWERKASRRPQPELRPLLRVGHPSAAHPARRYRRGVEMRRLFGQPEQMRLFNGGSVEY